MKNFFEKHSIMVITCTILAIFVLGLFINAERSLSYSYGDNSAYYYGNNYNVYKEVKLISNKIVELDYEIDLMENQKNRVDYLLIADTSKQSMDYTGCYGQAYNYGEEKHNCIQMSLGAINDTAVFRDSNTFSFATFNNDFNLVGTNMTRSDYYDAIYEMTGSGQANYEKALKGIQSYLANYTYDQNRRLKIVIILNSIPASNLEKERDLYKKIKTDYPFANIILVTKSVRSKEQIDRIDGISDYVFLAGGDFIDSEFYEEKEEMPNQFDNLEYDTRSLFDDNQYGFYSTIDTALFLPNMDEIKLEDILDKRYFNFNNFKIIEKTSGDVDYKIVDGKPVLTWQLNKPEYQMLYLKVQLSLNDGADNNIEIPVSENMKIDFKIKNIIKKEEFSDTPYLRFYYEVNYDKDSIPGSCVLENIPDKELYKYNEIVDLSNKKITCDEYIFNNWLFNNMWINYDYFDSYGGQYYFLKHNYIDEDKFYMPAYDLMLTPNIGRINVSKNITEYTDKIAYLDLGNTVNKKIKSLKTGYSQVNNFIRSNTLPTDIELGVNNIVTISSSPEPVYVWYNQTEKIYYYYSDADIIYLNPDSSNIFSSLQLKNADGFSDFNTSLVKNFEKGFMYNELNNLNALSNWNVSSVTNMGEMFVSNNLINLDGISNWDISNVTNMREMFRDNGLNNVSVVYNWNMKNVTNIYYIFANNSLTTLEGISNWNIPNVVDMSGVFSYNKLTNISDIVNFDMSKIRNISRMFESNMLTNLNDIQNWDISNVTNMESLFSRNQLTNILGIKSLNLSNVTNMTGLFSYNRLTNLSDISDWNISYITNISNLFYGNRLTNLDALSNWDVSKVTNMSGLFSNNQLTNISGISNWDVSKVTNMMNLFYGNKLTNLDDLVNWNTSSVDIFSGIFSSNQLTDISGVSNWDISKTNSLSNVFSSNQLTDVSGISNWDVSKIESFDAIFSRNSLSNLNDLSNWNVSSGKQFNNMFIANKLTDISGISNWNMSNAYTISGMFYSNPLTDLNALSNWDVSNVKQMQSAFGSCSQLTDASGINDWNINSRGYFNYMFRETPTHPEFSKVTGTWDSKGTFYPNEEGY